MPLRRSREIAGANGCLGAIAGPGVVIMIGLLLYEIEENWPLWLGAAVLVAPLVVHLYWPRRGR